MKQIFLCILFILISTISSAQSQSEQLDVIIHKLEILEETKSNLIDYKIHRLQLGATGKDSIQTIQLKKRLTDEVVLANIKSALSDSLSTQEINDLYTFVKTSAFDRIFVNIELPGIISSGFEEINAEISLISENIDKERFSRNRNPNFEPVVVDRKDGFYATLNYEAAHPDKIELVKEPSITLEEIKVIEEDLNFFGDKILILELSEKGKELFHALTLQNLLKPIAIVIDSKIISLPIITEPISGGRISLDGNFTEQEVKEMIEKLTRNRL